MKNEVWRIGDAARIVGAKDNDVGTIVGFRPGYVCIRYSTRTSIDRVWVPRGYVERCEGAEHAT